MPRQILRDVLLLGSDFSVRRHHDVEEVVGSQSEDPLRRSNLGSWLRLVTKNDGGDVDSGRVEFRGGGDGVETRLESRDVGDDSIEGDGPDGGVGRRGRKGGVVSSCDLKNLGESKMTVDDLVVVDFLVRSESSETSLDLLRGSVLREEGESLTRRDGRNVEVVTEDGVVGGRSREGDLGESRIEGDDVENGVSLVSLSESEDRKDPFDLDVRVAGPESDVISVLVRDS